ncbi:hypothetical protein ACWDRR_05985 [Kitasatospora sp. NPDC003701]
MARNELRPIIKLRSTAGTGCTYVARHLRHRLRLRVDRAARGGPPSPPATTARAAPRSPGR